MNVVNFFILIIAIFIDFVRCSSNLNTPYQDKLIYVA